MFGGGDTSAPIWMDDLSCTGSEEDLSRCPFGGWGKHNCVHAEDVGVYCEQDNGGFYNNGGYSSGYNSGYNTRMRVWDDNSLIVDQWTTSQNNPSSFDASGTYKDTAKRMDASSPRRGGGRDAREREDWASRKTLKPGGVMRHHLLSTQLNQLPPLVEQNQALAASREARARGTRVGSTASAARDRNDTAVQLHLHAQSVCGTREFFSPVAAGNNTAQYGPCIASGYHRLGLKGMPTRQTHAGVMLNLYVVKLDQYEQIMTADSSSSLQVYSALEGTKVNDNSVTFIGNIISGFREGQAVFQLVSSPRSPASTPPIGAPSCFARRIFTSRVQTSRQKG
jgi:hypothetical protein